MKHPSAVFVTALVTKILPNCVVVQNIHWKEMSWHIVVCPLFHTCSKQNVFKFLNCTADQLKIPSKRMTVCVEFQRILRYCHAMTAHTSKLKFLTTVWQIRNHLIQLHLVQPSFKILMEQWCQCMPNMQQNHWMSGKMCLITVLTHTEGFVVTNGASHDFACKPEVAPLFCSGWMHKQKNVPSECFDTNNVQPSCHNSLLIPFACHRTWLINCSAPGWISFMDQNIQGRFHHWVMSFSLLVNNEIRAAFHFAQSNNLLHFRLQNEHCWVKTC